MTMTRTEMAKMIAGHPDASMPRIFEAALSGSSESSPALRVMSALDCCIALMKIESAPPPSDEDADLVEVL